MKTKIINLDNINNLISALREGETVAFKTDTIYGLSCIASSESACKKLVDIKGRENKPLILLVPQSYNIDRLVHLPIVAKKIIENFWPGPLTIIFKSKHSFNEYITCGADTIALRIPDDKLCQTILEAVGEPIVSTSANLSGKPNIDTPEEILRAFDGYLPYILDTGNSLNSRSSTIVHVDGDNISILREGDIGRDNILKII